MDRGPTVAIVGVGLIGGSVGLALRARGLARRVIGIGRDEARLDQARRLGAIDEGTTDIAHGADGADIAVVCTPVDRVAEDVRRLAEFGRDDLLITDAGSTKARIVEAVERHPSARTRFVGAHPIAGSERQGADYARADLFRDRPCVLTPTPRTPGERLERARQFWTSLGMKVTLLDPIEHDQALALTSHLPHAVAAALGAVVPVELLGLAGGAYRDVTRVAAADASLWTAIFRDNRRAMLDALAMYRDRIDALNFALMADDAASIRAWWDAGRVRRAAFHDDAAEPTPTPREGAK